jgi:hypothetical protein
MSYLLRSQFTLCNSGNFVDIVINDMGKNATPAKAVIPAATLRTGNSVFTFRRVCW